jgi:hypothetical protein
MPWCHLLHFGANWLLKAKKNSLLLRYIYLLECTERVHFTGKGALTGIVAVTLCRQKTAAFCAAGDCSEVYRRTIRSTLLSVQYTLNTEYTFDTQYNFDRSVG